MVLRFLPSLFVLPGLILLYMAMQSMGAYAQTAGYHVAHYTDLNGLPQNSIKDIAPDSEGFIWLATENGLARFDGGNFDYFDKSIYPIFSNRVFTLNPSLDNPGRLYALMEGDNVLTIGSKGVSLDSAAYFSELRKLPGWQRDTTGRMFKNGPQFAFEMPQSYSMYLIPVSRERGSFFVCSRDGRIVHFQNWKTKQVLQTDPASFARIFRLGHTLFINKDKGGIERLLPSGSREQAPMTGDVLKNPAYRNNPEDTKIHWNNTAGQVFLLSGDALYLMTPGNDGTLGTQLLLTGFDFEEKHITTVYYNPGKKLLFLGSIVNGLFVVTPQSFQTLQVREKDYENVFYAQGVWDDHTVFTPRGYLLGLQEGKKVGERWGGRNIRTLLPDMTNYTLLKDHDGHIWTCKEDTLYRFDRQGEAIMDKWVLPHKIHAIHMGVNNVIWISVSRSGVFKIEPGKEPEKVVTFPAMVENHPRSPEYNEVYCILNPAEGILWLGAIRGLYRADTRTGKFEFIDGTEDLYIRSLSSGGPGGKDSELWFTTFNDGFFLYKNGTLTNFPIDKKGYLRASHCMFEDRKGYFWVPTNKGLFQIKKTDLLHYAENAGERPFYLYYSSEQGFATSEFNGGCTPCAVRLPSGYVSLPSLKGLVWFNPEKIDPMLPDRDILIDRIELNGQTMYLRGDSLYLPRNGAQLELFVRTLYFGNQANLHYHYALVRNEPLPAPIQWHELGSQDAKINLSHLGKGTYRLYLQKANGFGANNISEKTISIIVPPYWYETPWMYALFILLLATAILLLFRQRIRRVKRLNEQLESEVANRTNQLRVSLQQLTDTQKELNKQMYLQSRLITSIAHDARSPLNSVILIAEETRKLMEARQYDEANTYNRMIGESLGNVVSMLENLLTYLKAQVYNKKMAREKVILRQLISQNLKLYKPALRGNDITNEVNTEEVVYTSPQILDVIVQNLVENANKYTSQGKIRIYTTRMPGEDLLRLSIEDSGAGLPEEILTWLNSGTEQPQPDSYHGVGLILVRELCSISGIVFRMENLAKGARATLTFPLSSPGPDDTPETPGC